MKKHDLRLDLIKLVAATMVVVLHVIENGGGYMQQCIYLVGCFGIPLFLMVNGYLLYNRDLNFSYILHKTIRYIRFMLWWIVIIGILEIFINHKVSILPLAIGAFLGSGRLYHLWLLFGLMLIYIIAYLQNAALKIFGKTLQSSMTPMFPIVVIVLMQLSFLADNVIFHNQLRNIIPGPFRIITNGGYFLLGMYTACEQEKGNKFDRKRWWPYLVVVISAYLGICLLSIKLSVKWASSFYSCIFCIAATWGITKICLSLSEKQSVLWFIVNKMSSASIGLWILHPIALSVIHKMLEHWCVENTLLVRVLSFFIVYMGCMSFSILALKVKGVRRIFQI